MEDSMSNKIIVEITYNLKGLRDIIVGDLDLNIDPIRGKDISEWFDPIRGRVAWKGLISECKELLQDDEAEFEFEFHGNDKNKSFFYKCLEENGYSRPHEQLLEHKNAKVEIETKDGTIEKQSSDEEILNKAKRMENLGNIDEAIQLYLNLAQNGNAEGHYKYAELKEKLLDEQKVIPSDHERYQVFLHYDKAANLGHPEAMFCLARCYDEGIGVDKNINEHAKWCEKAANLGVVGAMRILAYDYREGLGVSKSIKLAIEWYKKAAEYGDIISIRHLGLIYSGYEDEQNFDEAKKWFKLAAQDGDEWSQYHLGVMSDGNEAVEWLTKAAEQDVPEAIYALGMHYFEDEGIETNKKKAFELFKKAADANYIGAFYRLGWCFLNGYGTESDPKRACECFEHVISQECEDEFEYSYSLYFLGRCYFYGNGVDEDDQKALDLFERASEYKIGRAYYYLGLIYDRGYGVNIDEQRAFNYYKKAALIGDGESQYIIGYCYMYGALNTEKNEFEAFSWFKKAAEQGHVEAEACLSDCYLNGEGIEKDEQLGMGCLTNAANNGSARAQYNMGVYYQNGIIVSKNTNMAIHWYEKAADQNFISALINLACLYTHGEYTSWDIEKVFNWLKRAGDYYCDNSTDGDDLCNVANMYDYLLLPEDIRKKTSKNVKTTYCGAAIALIGCVVSTPLMVGGALTEAFGLIKTFGAEKKHYTEILKTSRGIEMYHFYEEAANRNSKEAQKRVKYLEKYLK